MPGKVPCGVCGRPRWKGKGMYEVPTCHDCRAKARAANARPCQVCAKPMPTPNHVRYCSRECQRQDHYGFRARYPMRQRRALAPTVERGYGVEHQRLRKALLVEAYGQNCPLCGAQMAEDQPLELDHSDDRTAYVGMVHRWCNRAKAARKTNRLRAERASQPAPVPWGW